MRAEASEQPGAEWDAFVGQQPEAALGHASAWAGALQRAYGVRPCYWLARGRSGALHGVLPLVHFRTPSGRLELISLPYLDAAGVLAESPDAERALLQRALELLREKGAQSLELRQIHGLHGEAAPARVPRVDLALRLAGDESSQWHAIGAKARNQTRKAEREGLALAHGETGELLRAFYAVYATNMRDLGSPPHSHAFFAAIAGAFGKELRVFVARHGARPVGGLIAIHHAGRVSVPWASTLRSERPRCPNNLIYWEALRWAISLGAREFDFGRSPRDSGTYHFKRGWGAEERPLAWTRLSASGQSGAVAMLDEHPVLRHAAALWARIPVPLSTWAGSRIRRYLKS